MTRIPSPAVFRSEDLNDLLRTLDPNDKRLKWIKEMEDVLNENMYAGDLVKKKQIPLFYVECYGVNNLYRYAHCEGYRSCYTIFTEEGLGKCPHILDLMSHDEYDKRFGYRKKR